MTDESMLRGIVGPEMREGSMMVTEGERGRGLAREWPATAEALEEAGWCRGEKVYAAAGLRNMEALWHARNMHRPVSHAAIDAAAAAEVRFHFERGRQFRRQAAALWRCWAALVIERPERIVGQEAAGTVLAVCARGSAVR